MAWFRGCVRVLRCVCCASCKVSHDNEGAEESLTLIGIRSVLAFHIYVDKYNIYK